MLRAVWSGIVRLRQDVCLGHNNLMPAFAGIALGLEMGAIRRRTGHQFRHRVRSDADQDVALALILAFRAGRRALPSDAGAILADLWRLSTIDVQGRASCSPATTCARAVRAG